MIVKKIKPFIQLIEQDREIIYNSYHEMRKIAYIISNLQLPIAILQNQIQRHLRFVFQFINH